jgi:DNA-binding beta-propeller fold protein YncE
MSGKIRISFIIVLACLTIDKTYAQKKYVFEKSISLPGNGGYDYLKIDEANHKLYVSHQTTVDVIDLNTEKPIGVIEGMQSVHGIAIVNDLNKGFISDSRANEVIVFDIRTLKVIKRIPLTKKGADAIMYDPYSHLIFTFNGDSESACVIDPVKLKEQTTIDLGGEPEFAVADGKGIVYNNLEDKSRLDVIDTKALKVLKSFPLAPCGGPTGLALDAKNKRLFTVCRENKGMSVVSIETGKIVNTLAIGAGVDAVVYDEAQHLVFVSNGDGTATIFKQNSADTYELFQTLKTAYRAKTMALDSKTHKIYFSVADYETGSRNTVSGTFRVMVYHQN